MYNLYGKKASIKCFLFIIKSCKNDPKYKHAIPELERRLEKIRSYPDTKYDK
jgi:hypothetical protein